MAQSLACKSHECPQCELRLQHLDMVVRVRYGPFVTKLLSQIGSFAVMRLTAGMS
ncbi:MAG: hypothetical protein ACU0A2_14595 [Cognatishimia sp.]|uniref:hypothetical protein n=1 Tax=Cognatishimia sp. TaxID=2211648 RepID=UPI0040586491